jgi:hypothetical protein
VLNLIGKGPRAEQQRAYGKHVEEAIRQGLQASPWDKLEANLILGSGRFAQRVREQIGIGERKREQPQSRRLKRRPGWNRVIEVVEEFRGERWDAFRNRHGDWGRELVLYLARRQCGLSLRELGNLTGGLDYAAVSVAIRRYERRLLRQPELRKVVENVKRQLLNVET